MASSPTKPEVFSVSFSIERQWVKEVVRAVLGAILFQRVLGNFKPRSVEVCGVTFAAPSDPELEALVASKAEEFSRALLDSSSSAAKPSRLMLALYPTPLSPRTPPPPKPRPPVVSSALGWFSASSRLGALVAGGEEAEEAEEDTADYGKVWEGWVVDVEVVPDGRRGVGEERLRSQLNDFLLRSLMFTMEKTAHVPPITSADLQPFGMQILINPSVRPFAIPKAVVVAPTLAPLLHKSLVASARGAGDPEVGREGSVGRYSR